MSPVLVLAGAMAMAVPSIVVRDSAGKSVRLPVRGKVTCVLFVAPDCPIANRMSPEIRRIVAENRNVAFFFAYPKAQITADAANKHRREFGLASPAILDGKFRLAKFAKAAVTPEAVLFDAKGRPAYRGRINDQFTEHNVVLAKPVTNDLRDALVSVLAGKTVARPFVAPVGCPIAFR